MCFSSRCKVGSTARANRSIRCSGWKVGVAGGACRYFSHRRSTVGTRVPSCLTAMGAPRRGVLLCQRILQPSTATAEPARPRRPIRQCRLLLVARCASAPPVPMGDPGPSVADVLIGRGFPAQGEAGVTRAFRRDGSQVASSTLTSFCWRSTTAAESTSRSRLDDTSEGLVVVEAEAVEVLEQVEHYLPRLANSAAPPPAPPACASVPVGQSLLIEAVVVQPFDNCPRICARRSSATLPWSSTLPTVRAISVSFSSSSRKMRPSMVSDSTRL